ncbi:asparagine synthase-related protein [Marinomonas mediterranea]|uniref:asparagine synthase-related protein n=1 Tax=Marinomonas mediterranea TaxID=119864 RepID=UPI00234AF7A1|nr:asparagine synthase-related protein [Marinomonas mediterranea]WCN08580.1 hypothetical protein GV055_06375 [Marinomonas mediterranea]WCN12634.1 hypothetical protein GV054_06215 [Marinomonas mediterranea]
MTALYTSVFTSSKYDNTKTLPECFYRASDYWKPDRQGCIIENDGTSVCMAKSWLYVDEASREENIVQQRNVYAELNGYFTNKQHLCEKLRVSTQICCTDLLIHAYNFWGEKCVEHLEGSFCFILWNSKSQTLFFAVDHFSSRSLFYSTTKQGILVTNEPNAFFTTNWLPKKIDERALVDALSGVTYPITTAPIIKGIKKLPPAHSLSFSSECGTNETRYWHSSMLASNALQSQATDVFEKKYTKKVKEAVLTTIDYSAPVATELSEGLDSSGVAGIAALHNPNHPLYTLSHFCLNPNTKENVEWEPYYRPIMETLSLHSNLKPVYQDSMMDYMKDVDRFIEATGGSFFINTSSLLRPKVAATTRAKIILTGYGGDHCASSKGSSYLSDLYHHRRWKTLHSLIKYKNPRKINQLKTYIHLTLKAFLPSAYFKRLIKNSASFEGALCKQLENSYLKPFYINKYKLKQHLINGLKTHSPNTLKKVHDRNLNDMDIEQRLLAHELASRFYRLEYRYPLLDLSVVRHAYNAPISAMFKDGLDRHHFRTAIKGYVTEEILKHDKRRVAHPRHLIERLIPDFESSFFSLDTIKKYCRPKEELTKKGSTPGKKLHFIDIVHYLKYLENNSTKEKN